MGKAKDKRFFSSKTVDNHKSTINKHKSSNTTRNKISPDPHPQPEPKPKIEPESEYKHYSEFEKLSLIDPDTITSHLPNYKIKQNVVDMELSENKNYNRTPTKVYRGYSGGKNKRKTKKSVRK